jgi:ubiquitin C-terminal hydrolase
VLDCRSIMIPNLTAALANRKKFVDEVSEVGQGTGYGSGSASSGASGAKYNAFSFTAKSETNLTGLQNQGATCYLNSLIQALYHCNEFRVALYEFEYDMERHGPEESCLTRQLQKLFAMLQLSDRGAITTNQLTAAFGWTSADSFHQQDVQECMAVIFEHIQCNGGENLANFFANLWSGKYFDGLTCQNCLQSRGQSILFRDLQIPVRGQHDLHTAIQSFFEAELLDGVSCEHCDGRFTHSKGFSLQSLPYFLSLQLKRFDIDWNTGQRVKIHDKLSFPSSIDMSRYLHYSAEQSADVVVDTESGGIYDLLAVLIHSGGAHAGHYMCYLRDWRHSEAGAVPEEVWNCFNDSTVTPLTSEDVSTYVGFDPDASIPRDGSRSGDSTPVSTASTPTPGKGQQPKFAASSGNAYMLLYRKRGAINLNNVSKEQIPWSLREFIENDNTQYNTQKAQWEYERAFLRLSVKHEELLLNVTIHETSTVQQLVDMVHAAISEQAAHREAQLASGASMMTTDTAQRGPGKKSRIPVAAKTANDHISVPEKNCMVLRVFDSIRGVLQEPLGGGDLSRSLASLPKADVGRPLHVQIVSPNDDLSSAATESVPFNVVIFQQSSPSEEPVFSAPHLLMAPSMQSTRQLLQFIASNTPGAAGDTMVCCMVNEESGVATQVVASDETCISSLSLAGTNLYVDIDASAVELTDGSDDPRLLRYFNDFRNMVLIPVKYLGRTADSSGKMLRCIRCLLCRVYLLV